MKKNGIALAIILSVVICLFACLFTACGTTINLGTDITITFMVDGEVYHEMEVKNDKTVRMPAEPEKDGYVFAGWYLSEDYEEVFTSSYLRNNTVVADITVYAKWVTDDNPPPQGTFTIHFNSMGGSEVADIVLSEGATFVLPDDPTKTGYTFAGWYLDESYQTIFESTSQLIDGIVLYAKWVEEHEHSYTTTTFAPDCENDGYTKYYCECGYYYFDEQVPATGHTPSEWIVDTEPNCLDAGSKHKECTVCNNTIETEVIPATGHTWAWIVDKNATVTESGLKHEECSICHAKQNENTTIDPLDCSHEGTLIHHTKVDATCTEDGTIEYWHCTACDKKYTDAAGQILAESLIIPSAGGHNPTDWIIDSEATCTVNGSKHKECTVCNNTIETKVIPAAHDYEDVRTDPTCTEQGYTIHHCEVCGYSYTDSYVDAKGHSPIVDPAVAATCTRTGLTEGSHCVACGTIIIPQEIIPASGHKPTDWIIDKEATDTEDGSKHKECSECHVVLETEVIPATGENLVYVSEIFYYYNGTGVDLETWIRLTTAGNWIEDSGNVGEYQIIDGNLTLILDGEQFAVGTITEDTIVITVEGQMLIYKTKDSVGGGQQGSGDVDETAKITGILGGTVEGFVVSLDVVPTVNDVDLSGMITVSEDSSWQLYADKTGQTLIPTKMAADLKDGENLYYIVVNSGDGKVNRLYTLSIYRNFYTNVYFVNEQEIVLDTIIGVLSHTYLEEHAPIFHEGYTYSDFGCDGWYVNEKNKKFCAGVATPHEYKVTLDPGEGSVLADHTYVTFDVDFTLEIPVRTGYSFVGWYDGETQITDATGNSCNVYQYVGDKTFTAEWQINQYEITLQSSNDAMGIVDGDGSYDYNSTVTITAETRAGHMFLGWYDGNNRLTTSLVYELVVPAENKTFTAKWMINPITLLKNIDRAGTVSMPSTTIIGEETTITATTNPGYTWLGWYNGDTKVSEGTNLTYTFTMPAENKTYTAKWSKVMLTTTPSGAGSVTSLTGRYNVGDEVAVTATTNPGYTWLGWYDGDTKVSEGTSLTYTFTMSAENKTYTAKWSKVTLATTPTGVGSISSLTGQYNVGDEVTVTATTSPGYTWLGWYNGDTKVSDGTSLTYTFTMSAENKTYTAKWAEYYVTVEKNIDDAGGCYIDDNGSISFNLNGASGTVPTTQGSGVATYPSIPVRSGYVFAGWYDNQSCIGSPYDFTQGVTEDIILYAKWIPHSGAVVLNINSSQSIIVPYSSSYAKYYAFVPLTSGQITIYTTGDLDTVGSLYDSSKSRLQTDHDSGEGNNFKITYNVIAGTLYYVSPKGYSYNGTTTLYLQGAMPEDGGAIPGRERISTGEDVSITAATNLGYTWLGWYDGDTKVSEGTSLTYTFTMPAVSKTYTAKWMECPVTLEKNIPEAGTVSGIETTAVGGETIITATTNPGYTWLGWYDGDIKVSEGTSLTYSFTMTAENKTYTAKWACYTVSTETNLEEAGTYTVKTEEKVTVGETVELIATTNPGYTWLGWYDGDTKVSEGTSLTYSFTMTAENKTYTAKWACYTISTETNLEGAGTYTVKTEEKVAVGETVELTATTNLGYTWLGWYDGDTKVSEGTSMTYTFTMSTESKTYTAKWEISAEMQNFYFTSTSTTCTIIGIKDKTVTSIVVPDYVTEISKGAFSGCSSLESTTTPFVGATLDGTSNTHFGYIFGASSHSDNTDYVPSSLKEVVVTGGASIDGYTFYGCSSLTSITIPDSVTSISSGAFSGCSSLESITIPFVGAIEDVIYVSGAARYPFGYIFGTSNYTGGTAVKQQYYHDSLTSTTYYIPASLRRVTVTGGYISHGAFYNCSMLTSITIPDTNDYVFYNCTSLTSVTFNGFVYSISESAFEGCSSLESITIPDSVRYIGKYAFSGCASLESITIPDSVDTIIAGAFKGCGNLISMTLPFVGNEEYNYGAYDYYRYPFGYIFGHSSYTGGIAVSQTTYINDYSDYTYYIPASLRSVTVTGGNIPRGAFDNCSMLTSITLGDRITSIGLYAFDGCSSLTSITIPVGVTDISQESFLNCDSLTSVTFEDTTHWYVNGNKIDVTNASTNATYLKATYESYAWHKADENGFRITNNGTTLLRYFGSSTEIVIPDGVTSIEDNVFRNCGLTSITIPASVTSIGDGAFFDCSSLTDVYYLGTIEQWFGIIFSGWYSNPMYYADNLYIDGELLAGELVVPNTVTEIKAYAFEYCDSLTSITIPDSVTTIGYYVFCGCTSLTSIVIPASVISIGSDAFYNCSSLAIVYYGGAETEWANITIGSDNTSLTTTTRYYYSECIHDHNHWKYDSDGNISTELTVGDWIVDVEATCTTNGSRHKECTNCGEEIIRETIIADPATGHNFENNECCSICSAEYYTEGLQFSLSNEEYIVTGISASATDITIPSTYQGLPVVGIATQAFGENKNLLTVKIPDSVTSIGLSSFEGCSSLESITIPFVGETKDGTENTHFGYIFGAGSYDDHSIYVPSSIKEVVITGGTSVDKYAFYGCTCLTSIVIPDSVTSIGIYAFCNCSSLTSITIPASVTTIGKSAFTNCYRLVEVYNKSGLNIVAGSEDAYYALNVYTEEGGSKLSTDEDGHIIYTDGDDKILVGYVGDETDLVIPNGITAINRYAFYNCDSLTSITIPDSVTSIGIWVFEYCSSLTKVIISDIGAWCSISFGNGSANPLRYAEHLYIGETEVTDLVIPDGVTEIKDYAFLNCTSLTSITIPDSVTSISSGAFSSCKNIVKATMPTHAIVYIPKDNLKTVVITSGVSIGNNAFKNCTSLTSITIPDSVTTIGSYAFDGCTSLTSVTFGENSQLTTIGDYAFYYCISLTSIVIPDRVTSIGIYAFYGCSRLTSITFEDTTDWYRTTSETDWSNTTGGTLKNVADASTNATNFTSTSGYYNYYWYKV